MLEIIVNHTLVFVPERRVRFRTNFYFEYQFYVHVIFFLPSTHFYDTCSFMQNCYLKIWLMNYLIFIFMINAYLTISHIPYQNPYIVYVVFVFCQILSVYHELLSIVCCFTRVNIYCTLGPLHLFCSHVSL